MVVFRGYCYVVEAVGREGVEGVFVDGFGNDERLDYVVIMGEFYYVVVYVFGGR